MADKDKEPLRFGKHKGETPESLLDTNPTYIIWLYENVENPPVSKQLYDDALMSGEINSEFINDRRDLDL